MPISGETGTGKTSLLSLLANIVRGHTPEQFVNFNDDSIEAGGGSKHSQTNQAKVYEFTSVNGVKVTILDTPGLADTRGFAQDELHKASIASAIKENISTVNAVLILANGTVPRLGTATDYALSTLSSIFPRTLADNIGIMFTNVASPLSWNFDHNSLPDVLRGDDNHWLLDNPVAMWNRYLELKAQPKFSKKILSNFLNSIKEGHQKSLQTVSTIFDWLDGLEPQPTNEIMHLYEQSQQIDRDIDNALSRMTQISDKKRQISKLKQLADGSALVRSLADRLRHQALTILQTMKQYENFKGVITSKVWKQERTSSHNTLCSKPNCYSNCHIQCGLKFSLDPEQFLGCSAIKGGNVCRECNHPYDSHRHYNSLWKLEDHRQESIDHKAEEKYNKAKREKNNRETMIVDLDNVISRLDSELEETYSSLSRLTESYAKLSLSGSFAGQIKKSVRLMEESLEAMRSNKELQDLKSIEMFEKSLENMKRKLKVVEAANEKEKGVVEAANEKEKGVVEAANENGCVVEVVNEKGKGRFKTVSARARSIFGGVIS